MNEGNVFVNETICYVMSSHGLDICPLRLQFLLFSDLIGVAISCYCSMSYVIFSFHILSHFLIKKNQGSKRLPENTESVMCDFYSFKLFWYRFFRFKKQLKKKRIRQFVEKTT